jgi:hypothetical protein
MNEERTVSVMSEDGMPEPSRNRGGLATDAERVVHG